MPRRASRRARSGGGRRHRRDSGSAPLLPARAPRAHAGTDRTALRSRRASRPARARARAAPLRSAYPARTGRFPQERAAASRKKLALPAGRLVRLLPPDPQHAAEGRNHRRKGALVQPGVISRARNGRLRLLLAVLLGKLPDTPAQYGVASVHNSHGSPFVGEPTKAAFPPGRGLTREGECRAGPDSCRLLAVALAVATAVTGRLLDFDRPRRQMRL